MTPPNPEPMPDVTGVVLAGGQSARMGEAKAALQIGGEPLLRRVAGRLGLAFAHVLVVGPGELRSLVPLVRVVTDQHPGLGPLAGLESALAAADTPRVFVVACDMPFVSPALARYMAGRAAASPDVDAVALTAERGLEPLHAVYATSCLPVVREQLAAGRRSLHQLHGRLRVLTIPPAEAAPFDPRGL